MINKKIPLREKLSGNGAPVLTTYVLDDPLGKDRKRPAVLVFPGGGYEGCSPREAEPIAMKFCAAGYQAFVLNYSVKPAKYPMALEEASMAVCLIREHAGEWAVDPEKIAVCGFSAGGHLAANLATCWNHEELARFKGNNRPDAAILSYPVITSGKYAHEGSFQNLLEDPADEKMRQYVSLETQVSQDTPPCFLWHTVADNAVPVENSLLFAAELQKNHIPFELHIYPQGHHGLSLVTPEVCEECESFYPHVATWMPLAIEWLDHLFGKGNNEK